MTGSFGELDSGLQTNRTSAVLFFGRENIENGRIILINWTIRVSPSFESLPIDDHAVYSWMEVGARIFDNGDSQAYSI
jgi:hypothetical protein